MQININNRYFLALIPLAILFAIIYYLSDIVGYVISAWILSMIGAPVVVFLRKYVGKNAAALITLFGFVLIFFLLIWILVPPLVTQAKNITNIDYNKVILALEEPVRDWEKWLVDKKLLIDDSSLIKENDQDSPKAGEIIAKNIWLDSLGRLSDSTESKHIGLYIQVDASQPIPEEMTSNNNESQNLDFFDKIRENVSYYLSPRLIQSMFSSTVSFFGNILVAITSVFFIGFFFLREQGLFSEIISGIVPEGYEEQTRQAITQTSTLLIRYFIGILIQMTTIALFVSTSLALLGIKNALLIGFFAALMNIIPYMGPLIGAVFGVTITISSNLNVSFYDVLMPELIQVAIIFSIAQIIDNFILQPNIFSKSVKSHPLEIFILTLVAAKIGGILGMILAIPLYTVFRVVGKVFLNKFKVIQKLTRNI